MTETPVERSALRLPAVVLASQSPRRRELLTLIGIPHAVRPSDIDETAYTDEAPAPHAERLAREKALTLSRREPAAVVIGADTIVVIDGEILGKPRDAEDARRMLRQLGGRTHTVFTATAVARGDRVLSAIDAVSVTFRPLSDTLISAYIGTGEPMDKAGAYGIQGFGATLVERIDGDYFSVMGLALGRLIELCAAQGLGYEFGAIYER